MRMDGLKDFVGKRVYIVLKTKRVYSGTVRDVEGEMLFLTDKFNENIMINVSEISSLEVEENKKEFERGR